MAGRVICQLCKQVMKEVDGCIVQTVYCNDTAYARIPASEDCSDCGAKAGQVHHYGCDQERCPACGGQLISCSCDSVHFKVILK